jgi:hypothetical protein
MAKKVSIWNRCVWTRHRDLHVVDVAPIPDGLEHPVGEPERQDVLDGLLSQVVVDPEDLGLVERLVERPIQLARALEIVSERLLDDDLRVPMQLALRQSLHDQGVGVRGCGAVVEPAAVRAQVLVAPLEMPPKTLHRHLAVEFAGDVEESGGELGPILSLHVAAAEFLDGASGPFVELLVGHAASGVPHDGEPLRQQTFDEQVIEGWQQLSAGQVPGRAEDHDGVRLGRLNGHQPSLGGGEAASSEPSCRMAWPPNSCRSAAMTFAA